MCFPNISNGKTLCLSLSILLETHNVYLREKSIRNTLSFSTRKTLSEKHFVFPPEKSKEKLFKVLSELWAQIAEGLVYLNQVALGWLHYQIHLSSSLPSPSSSSSPSPTPSSSFPFPLPLPSSSSLVSNSWPPLPSLSSPPYYHSTAGHDPTHCRLDYHCLVNCTGCRFWGQRCWRGGIGWQGQLG